MVRRRTISAMGGSEIEGRLGDNTLTDEDIIGLMVEDLTSPSPPSDAEMRSEYSVLSDSRFHRCLEAARSRVGDGAG